MTTTTTTFVNTTTSLPPTTTESPIPIPAVAGGAVAIIVVAGSLAYLGKYAWDKKTEKEIVETAKKNVIAEQEMLLHIKNGKTAIFNAETNARNRGEPVPRDGNYANINNCRDRELKALESAEQFQNFISKSGGIGRFAVSSSLFRDAMVEEIKVDLQGIDFSHYDNEL